MPEKAKTAFRAAAAIVSIAIILVIVYAGWNQIKDAASLHRHWNAGWLLAAVTAQIVVYLCIGGIFAISLSIHRTHLSPFFLFYCAFAFLFANRSLPGPAVAGVAVLVYLMRGRKVAPVDAQTAAAAFYFADYAGFFTLIAAVSVPLIGEQQNHVIRDSYLIGLSIIVASAALAIWVLAKPQPFISIIVGSITWIDRNVRRDRVKSQIANDIGESATKLHANIVAAGKSAAQLAMCFVLSVTMHAAEVSTVIFGARAAGISIALPAAAASYVAGNLASIISVLPGAVGFYEAGMIGTLHFLGHVPVGDAAVCTMIYRILSFWAPLPVVLHVLLRVSKVGFPRSTSKKTAE